MTIHHLLTHTSGIHSYTGKPEFMKTVTMEMKPEELINSFKNDKFDFNPGEKLLYNNSGYFLLGYIVEKVSGMPFDDYLKEKFFKPLRMNNTGVHSWELNLENEAAGYSYETNSYKPAMKWDMSRAGGAGAIYSTVGDLYLWNEAIFNGTILSKSSLEAAFTPAKLNDGSEADAFGAKYGYGWMFSKLRGLETINHSGGFDGFNAYLIRFLGQHLTIAVLTNCFPPKPPEEGSIPLVGVSIADAAAYIYLWDQMETIKSFVEDKTVDTAVYDDYVGGYDYSPYGPILKITHEGDKLFAELAGQDKTEIFPSAKDKFFWKVTDAQVDFIRNEKGEVTHLIHHQSGMEIKAPKVKEEMPATVDANIYDDYTGEYDFGRATLTVTREGDKLFARMADQPKYEIFPRSETEFFWKVANAQIVFVKDEGGKVTKAVLKQAGMEIEVKKVK